MIDFHNHLLPGVDDGAASLDESRAACRALYEQGVRTVIVTPHMNAGSMERPGEIASRFAELDAAFEEVRAMLAAEIPELRLHRGVELMLDVPRPDLSDPRLRLAGTDYLLLEFPGLMVPPHSVQALYDLRVQGWRPVVAHPERYRNLDDVALVDEWRTVGAHIQVNSGSLLGRYGEKAEKIAWKLLAHGWVDYLSSDYHARGRVPVAECVERLTRAGGAEQVRLLTETNGTRLLAGEEPLPVAPLVERPGFWGKLLRRG